MSKQRLPLLAAIILAFLDLSIFLFDRVDLSGDSQTDQVVKVYYADNISAAHRKVIDAFNRLHKGKIEVVPVTLPFEKFSTNERKELLARSLRNKSDRLDVFSVDLIWVPRFSRWCEPMDKWISPAEQAGILPQALESCRYDSSMFAVPMYLDVGMLYFRSDLVGEIPGGDRLGDSLPTSISWDDFRALGRSYIKSGRPFYLYQGNDYEGLTCNFFELIAGQDPSFFKRGNLNFESAPSRTALTMLVDFVHRDRISPPEGADFDEIRSYTYALDHDAVAVRGWPNFIESYRLSYPDQRKLDQLRLAPLPHFPGQQSVSVYGGWNLMVSRYSSRIPESVELVRFFQRADMQKTMFEIGGYIPTNLEVYADSAYVRDHPVLRYYGNLIRRGFHRPALVDYTKMSDVVSRAVHRAIKGELPVDAALHEITSELRKAGMVR
jgi:multiple sugar transport system substrate-binding protein